MRARSPVYAAATALVVAALLDGCGSSTTTSPSPSASAAAPACPPPKGGANAATTVALTAGDLPSSAATFKQVGDGLLASTPRTDARVFASADGKTIPEVDLAVDTDAGAAASDYTAYMSAAAKQVKTESLSATPRIGSRANEFVGIDSLSRSVVSLSFVECSVIGVVTMVSATSTVEVSVVESIAVRQVLKIAG